MSVHAEEYMQRALVLAAKGWPAVAPNPMVGAVIVHHNTVVAEAHHQKFGGAHAEVLAIRELPDGIPPSECELYVTLEPCSHHGKTPPCTELIINKGFRKVYIASGDPNPLVNGKGIALLRAAGIAVITGVLEPEARYLNRRFYTFHEKKRPFITLKWAESGDGFISRLPLPQNRADNRISGEKALQLAHRLRAEHMAILVGKNTALADDPELSTRLVEGKNPIRILIDSQLQVPATARIFNNKAQTLVFNLLREEKEGHIEWIKLKPEQAIHKQILLALYTRDIQSLMVEGGTKVLETFIGEGLYDEVYRITNPGLLFGKGVAAPAFNFGTRQPQNLEGDLLYHFSRS